MTALIIIGIILAVLALIILILSLLAVDIIIFADNKQGFDIKFRILGKIIKTDGEKKETKGKKEGFLPKALANLLGVPYLENRETVKKEIEKRGALQAIQRTLETALSLVKRALAVIKRLRLIKCDISFFGGGEDAALEYGTACAAIYPTVAFLQNVLSFKRDAFNLNLRCDYDLPESEYALSAVIRLRVLSVLFALILKK